MMKGLPSIDLTVSFVSGNGRTKRIQPSIFQKLHTSSFNLDFAPEILYSLSCHERSFSRCLFTKLRFLSA